MKHFYWSLANSVREYPTHLPRDKHPSPLWNQRAALSPAGRVVGAAVGGVLLGWPAPPHAALFIHVHTGQCLAWTRLFAQTDEIRTSSSQWSAPPLPGSAESPASATGHHLSYS